MAFVAVAFFAVVFVAVVFLAVDFFAGADFVVDEVEAAAFLGSGLVLAGELSLVILVLPIALWSRPGVPGRPAPANQKSPPGDYWRRVTCTSTNIREVPEPEKMPESGLTSL